MKRESREVRNTSRKYQNEIQFGKWQSDTFGENESQAVLESQREALCEGTLVMSVVN